MNARAIYSILFVLTISIFGCNSNSSSTPDQGGTSGGGGNTVASQKIGNDNLRAAILNAKPVVIVWLTNQKRKCELFGCGPIYKNIFAASPDILEAAKNLNEIELHNGACLDDGHNERDASIFGKKAGTICMSSTRLLARLNYEGYENQVAALIVHELSHFAGASEDDASKIQKDFLALFQREFEVNTALEALISMQTAARGITQNLNVLRSIASGSNFEGDCAQLTQSIPFSLNLAFPAIASSERQGVLSRNEQRYWNAAMTKIYAAADFVCGVDLNVSAAERTARKALYESYFASSSQIAASEYPTRFYNSSEPSVVINRITDYNSFASELYDAIQIISEANKHIEDLSSLKFQTY